MYQSFTPVKISISLFLITTSITSLAADNYYSSNLHNRSNQAGQDGYFLVKDKVWSEHGGCVVDSGGKQVNPGESTSFKINKSCSSGGVQYQIFSQASHKSVGYLVHNFHDGSFSMEIKQQNGTRLDVINNPHASCQR